MNYKVKSEDVVVKLYFENNKCQAIAEWTIDYIVYHEIAEGKNSTEAYDKLKSKLHKKGVFIRKSNIVW